ncbi:hypothetical protein CR162_02900 [Pseudoroseomonas rhizosphaerae]|uniref:DUF5872 domain-containing protein n=1 Tax=Teichococcus rhizosphaerae TaxID=1335062 RepID=A0A2C7A869_9PROT|nr:hypothetical protein [Pseudoroseomonas rhizosphaerae]PHK96308.1 hypothetical protein CR162_02900 [Pseudoroseomonas rhizosphaerae]
MASTAEKTDPKLWEKVKAKVTRENKGGKPGQWSARKAQRAVSAYKEEGGGYKGRKSADNHLQKWQDEDWGTRSGEKSGETGERYLPRKARESLSKEEYDRSTAKKRADTRKGRQFSAQPPDVARKSARARKDGTPTREALTAEARRRDIRGRSRMTKAELQKALEQRA